MAFAVDLPSISARRTTVRRCGYPTQAEARAGLDRVLECERTALRRPRDRGRLPDQLVRAQVPLAQTHTQANYHNYLIKDLIPALGRTRLEELTHHHVACFVRDQLAAGRGPVTLRRCLGTCPARSTTPSATADSPTTQPATPSCPAHPDANESAGHRPKRLSSCATARRSPTR